MYSVNLQEAKQQLAKLIEEAARGEDVIITIGNGATFRIVPVELDTAVPKFGSARGLIKISDDFDEPVEGFEEYMP